MNDSHENPTEVTVVQGSDNVFADLGFEAKEAMNLKIRADLMLNLQQYIRSQDWTQEQAATFFEEPQPQISHLMNGDISRFSIDNLINLLAKAGMEVQISVYSRVA